MQLIMLIGLVGGVILLIFGILVGGGNLLWFWDAPSAIITFGGAVASACVAFPLSTLMKLPTLFKVGLFPQSQDLEELIITFVSFAEKARREGLLALEDDLDDVRDPFMKKGLQLIVDGIDPEMVRNIMEIEIDEIAARHDANKSLLDELASYAPGFGMIGTLMGLVMMLVNLSDRNSVGPYLAVAIITTFYGAVLAYLVFTPLGKRLDTQTGEEVTTKNIIVRGVLSIQSGENPRIVKDKLVAYLPKSQREKISEAIAD